ncbi:MAG: hypothetical protein QXQ02_09735 [Halobacteria archaeon]
MNGVNETLLARLHKKFEVEEIEKEGEGEGEGEGERKNQFKQIQTAFEELKAQIAKMQQEIKADLLSIDKKIEELLKVESSKKTEVKSEEGVLEERYVISPKTGVIEKVKAKKANYIEAKPVKKEEKPKSKKDIIEAEEGALNVKGNLFKRLKEVK